MRCEICGGEYEGRLEEANARAGKAEAALAKALQERDEYASGWEAAALGFAAEMGQVATERDAANARAEETRAALVQAEIERGYALAKARQHEEDWMAAKYDFGAATGRMRSRLREAERERDEARKERDEANEPAALAQVRARAEQAERERDKARALAVWVECYNAAGRAMGLVAVAPPPNPFEIRRHLDESDRWIGFGDGSPRFFDTEAEALAAGRAVPWWEVKA